MSNGRIPLGQLWIWQGFDPRRTGQTALDHHATPQFLQAFGMGSCQSFNLGPVAAPMSTGRIGEPLLKTAVVRQQQQTFAVSIEPARRIDPWNIDEAGEVIPVAAWLWRELTEHPVGLVEQNGCQWSVRVPSGPACIPEIDHTDRDQQKAQAGIEGGENHGGEGNCEFERRP